MKSFNGVAWLERIDNGTLVHYHVPVKMRRAVRPGAPPWGGARPWDTWTPDPEEGESDSEDRIIESYSVAPKTIFCATEEEILEAVKNALKADGEIARLQQDGKLRRSPYM
jgi:hypothetical protein